MREERVVILRKGGNPAKGGGVVTHSGHSHAVLAAHERFLRVTRLSSQVGLVGYQHDGQRFLGATLTTSQENPTKLREGNQEKSPLDLTSLWSAS